MNLRETIKLRCLDCEGRNCTFTDCPLYGFGKRGAQGNRSAAMRKYCMWCMNGHRVNGCLSESCSIFQFRKIISGDLYVDFLPLAIKPEVP
jgi:hypothetical protein